MASENNGIGEPGLDSQICNMDDLVAKHRKERKDLQAHIQKLKHGIPKGDKKKKKEVGEQIAKLEAELDSKQEKEQSDFKEGDQGNTVSADNAVNDDDAAAGVNESIPDKQDNAGRKSKAQKRREKKQGVESEREDRIKAQEIENRLGPRHVEMARIKEMLKKRGFALYEIPADGNCMYSAVSHQLASQGMQHSNTKLRQQTSDYMREHRDDFLPFLTHPDTGDMLSEEQYEQYCDKTASTPVWGGQVELRALSEVLRVPIEVLQAELDPLIVGEGMDGKQPITLVYHRHMYRMGEHYNSVVLVPQTEDAES